MKTWHKILAGVLAISILTTSVYLYYRKKKNEKEAGLLDPEKIKIENLENAILDASVPIKPERPEEITHSVHTISDPLQKVLLSDNVQYTQFLADKQLEEKILSAASLNDVAKSKKEVEALVKVREQIRFVLQKGAQQQAAEPAQQNQKNEQQHPAYNAGELRYIAESGLLADPAVLSVLEKLDKKLGELFTSGSPALIQNTAGPMKGTWTTPDKIILRWTPEGDWIPENGFNLYRTLNGETELIAEGLGSIANINKLADNGLKFSPYVQSLFQSAALDSLKMQSLGVQSERQFRERFLTAVPSSINPVRIPGDVDFAMEKGRLLSVPDTISAKMPLADSVNNAGLHFASEINARPVPLSDLDRKLLRMPDTAPDSPLQPELSPQEKLVAGILDARKSILTMALVDKEFANATGFGYEDDLSGMNISSNASVRYTVVPLKAGNENVTAEMIASGASVEGAFGISVKYGVEIPVETPKELDGIGADNAVSLRWKAPESSYARSIISGYRIERRKKNETEFVRINSNPVAISYTEDENNNILYETTSFFIDDNVHNGDELVYRVQAMDIFGRLSEFSDEIEVTVYKVTPPQQPILGQPTISVLTTGRTPKSHTQLYYINPGTAGVALPISKTSGDTSVFVIYRSEVCGNGYFGTPAELVRINIAPYIVQSEPVFSTNGYNGVFMLNPSSEPAVDTIYYDNTVKPGFYYKYWVAAVDSWGNESQWSESKVIGYPDKGSPDDPVNPEAIMSHNQAVESSSTNPPGFFSRYAFNRDAMNDVSGITGSSGKKADLSGLFGNATAVPELLENSDIDISGTLDALGSGNSTNIQTQTGNLQDGSYIPGGVNLPARNSVIGVSLSDAVRLEDRYAPVMLKLEMNNLPKPRDVHDIIALTNNDLTSDGKAVFTWNHYLGDGLASYIVYTAAIDGLSGEALRNMTREEIIENFEWRLAAQNVQINQLTYHVERSDNRLYAFMICLVPEKNTILDVLESFKTYLPAGWIRLQWERPDDPQISYFRVYRAEVPRFKDNEDLSALKWSMVADNLKYTVYSEKVDQTYAHYYYYKVTSVSVWGQESKEGAVTRYRVPATVPPQAPTMLVPFSKKGTNSVNWLGVAHASKYIIYRKLVPRIIDLDLQKIQGMAPELYDQMFNLEMYRETFANMSRDMLEPAQAILASNSPGVNDSGLAAASLQLNLQYVSGLESRFKTLHTLDAAAFKKNLSNISLNEKQNVVRDIIDKYGILALMPYGSLDRDLAATVEWEIAGELNIGPDEDSAGEKTFLDTNVVFGNTYLYTVQAVNDDNLASDRPEPVSVFTRKGQPFPPVTNLRWSTNDTYAPLLFWDPPRDPNLTTSESQKYMKNFINDGDGPRNTAGYLVYRSNTRDGEYFLVSGLVTWNNPVFQHLGATVKEDNWYKIRVVDTAGYISDFSEPLYVRDTSYIDEPDPEFEMITAYNPERENPIQTVVASILNPFSFRLGKAMQASMTGYLSPAEILLSKFQVATPTPKPYIPPLQTATPTPGLQQATPTPGFQQATPTPELKKPTPTPRQTATPTPKFQAATPTPKLQQNTPTPTPRLQQNTPTPTPKLQKATPTPTPWIQKATPTPKQLPQKATPTPKPAYEPKELFVEMKLNDFTIRDIPAYMVSSGKAEGKLMLGKYPVPVDVVIHEYESDRITYGYVRLKNGVQLGDTGICISKLDLGTDKWDAIVDGFVDCSNIGDLKRIILNKCRLTSSGVIHCYYRPSFHYDNLKITDYEKITFNFGNLDNNSYSEANLSGPIENVYGAGFINIHRGKAENNLGLEAVYSHGLKYTFDTISFDLDGELSGTFTLDGTQKMKLVIPAGLCIKATSSVFVYEDGRIVPSPSYITGKILTPFKTFEDIEGQNWNSPSSGEPHSVDQELLASILGGNFDGSSLNMGMLDAGLFYMSQMAQSSAMMTFPDDPAYEETLSNLSFTIQGWNGCGFMVQDVAMTPSNVPLYDPNKLTYAQEQEQAEAVLGITPQKVTVDLRRDEIYRGEAPSDTKLPEWMGIIIKSGNISLPPSYVQSKNGERIRFNLTPGELLYDQNGFCYQNQAYTPEGVSASFGTKLGTFDDVLVRNIVLDLYNNIADLEIEADMFVPLLKRRINVKMLKDDDGFFVCNVCETEKFALDKDGKVKLSVVGGFLDDLGMHLDATIDLVLGKNGEEINLRDAMFNDFIIPSNMQKMHPDKNPGIYGKALFDKPYMIKFHDFPMEIRGLEVSSVASGTEFISTMNLWGGMQLSDNLSMNANEDLDTIEIKEVFNRPVISLEESHSEVVMCFEDFAEVNATGRPIKTNGDCIEYDTADDDCELGFSSSNALDLTVPGFEFNTRIGYDRRNERCYFAVAIYYTGPGIPFACGEITDMGGIIGYNMDTQKNTDGSFVIPDSKLALLGMVDTLTVNKGSGNYFFAAACTITLGFGDISLGELRDVYLIVEKGPNVEMGGDYYGPDSIDDLFGNGSFAKMGTAFIGYYHPIEKFKFSLSLIDCGMYGVTVSGDIGFEMCPDYWELRIGHPAMLSASFGPLYGSFGLAIRNSDIDESFILAKVNLGFSASADIEIVYVSGFLEIGGEGYFGDSGMSLLVYVRGGISGGVLGHEVISLMLEAQGHVTKGASGPWTLGADARIRYHVDLLIDIKGSVNWHISKSF